LPLTGFAVATPIFVNEESSFPSVLDTSGLSRLRDPAPFHWNVQVMNLFPEGISIQTQQFRCLDLVAFGFLKRSGDQRALNGVDQHGVQVPP
jgi:hypothetical protein